MNKLYDTLANCIAALEQGEPIEVILSRNAELKDELRPMLEAALHARQLSASDPEPDVIRRGRAVFLHRAAQLRASDLKSPRDNIRQKGTRRIPAFQRLALAFSMAALFLLSGTGLVRASSGALPGEKLYPVKRTWENLRLFLAIDREQRESLVGEFEDERLDEVSELLTVGHSAQIRIIGFFVEVNGQIYISSIKVVITSATQLPASVLKNGTPVIVTGWTNPDGYVEASSVALLPAGSVVPAGKSIPVQADLDESPSQESESTPIEERAGSSDDDQSGSTDETDETEESSDADNSGSGSTESESSGDTSVDHDDNTSDDGNNSGNDEDSGDKSGSGGETDSGEDSGSDDD